MNKQDILITKTDGSVVQYNREKVFASITRTGADHAIAERILSVIEKKLKNGMKTSDIYKIIRKELGYAHPWAAARYNLREAITKLGPAGYNFEKYVASVLEAYGYKTATPETYKGACIEHEIDVTAEKDGRTAFIEAKFRIDFTATITIKDTLATWARFLDLVDGAKLGLCPHFDEVWIVTNARFTDQSLQFGHCKNIRLIGWNHPHERTFAQMVDLNALYPLTIIKGLRADELKRFSENNLILCREIYKKEIKDLNTITQIPIKRLDEIQNVCREVIEGNNA